ncbi:retrovirus-related pol polyprotein from transposon TNT 1-94, partial [Tanacetum coccineum]
MVSELTHPGRLLHSLNNAMAAIESNDSLFPLATILHMSAAKHPKWYAAMYDEMHALKINGTWDLVPRPMNANVVGSKWVFRTKFHSDGTIDRFKARLVAQGFTQVSGIDYSATFSPVVKASMVRIVLSLVVLHKWPLHQLDVKNAFLNGNLTDIVFMEQPPGFVDSKFPNHVCRLKKALYGL